MPDNIYPDLSNDRFDIQYARLLGLSSDLQASAIISGSDSPPPPIETPDDDTTGLMRFGAPAEDDEAGENRSFDLGAGFSFALTQLGNNHFLVDPPNGLYQLGAVPVPGSDSGLSYTYLEIDDVDKKITLQAPEGIVLPGYGYGNHSGTAAYNLAIDAGGNLIEVAAGGGGYTNLTQFVDQNNWKVFYSDGSGDVQELSIGASGDVLTSNGTSAAPSWQTPSAGSGTVNSGLQYKAAYYITNPSGTVIDDWAGCNFGQTNLNTQIVCQSATEVGMEIKAAGSQSANLLNISSSSSTGDYITVDGSGRSTFKTRARFQGDVVETAEGVDRVDIGVRSGTPRMVFEDSGNTIWQIDNFAGTFRWFTPGVVQLYMSTAAAGISLPFGVGPTAVINRMFNVEEDNATNSGVTYLARFAHTTSGTPGVGIGAGLEFLVETVAGGATGSVRKIGGIMEVVSTNVSDNTEAFDFVFKTMDAGNAATESLRILSDGRLKVTLLNQDDSETKVVVWNSTDKILEWRDAATFGGGSDTNFAEDDLTATGDRSHTFGAHTAEITFNSLAGDSGLKLTSTSTAAASNAQKLLHIDLSGANATSSQTTYGIYAANTHTGTSNINYGIYGTATGAPFFNYGVYGAISSGNGVAVYGEGNDGSGVIGYTTGSSTYGVQGQHAGTSGVGYGVYGASTGAKSTGYAGYFNAIDATTNYGVRALALGTLTTNIGGQFEATGATNNYALLVPAASGNIGFGTATPSAAALLELASTTQAFIIMRMTAAQASAITAADGMLLYVTDTDATFTSVGVWSREAGVWVKL